MNCANLIYGTTVFVEAVWLKQRVIKGPTRKNLSTILLSEIYWLPCSIFLHTTEEDRDCMPGTKVFLYLCIHSHWAIHCMPTGIFQQCFFVTVALQCVNYCPASHPLQIHFGKICCTHSTTLWLANNMIILIDICGFVCVFTDDFDTATALGPWLYWWMAI